MIINNLENNKRKMDDKFKKAFQKKYKAFKVDEYNKMKEVTAEEVDDILSKSCKKVEHTIDELETKIFESLDQLFKDKKSHMLIVDEEEIEPRIGYRFDKDYFSYINGHTLSDDNSIYRSITIEEKQLVVQEELLMKDRKIQQACINNFSLGFARSSPGEHEAFKNQLAHINQMLIQAVERKINDGEI